MSDATATKTPLVLYAVHPGYAGVAQLQSVTVKRESSKTYFLGACVGAFSYSTRLDKARLGFSYFLTPREAWMDFRQIHQAEVTRHSKLVAQASAALDALPQVPTLMESLLRAARKEQTDGDSLSASPESGHV